MRGQRVVPRISPTCFLHTFRLHGSRRAGRCAACVARGAGPRGRLTRTVRSTYPWEKAATREYRSPRATTSHTDAPASICQGDAPCHTYTCQGETGTTPACQHPIVTADRAARHIVDELYPRCSGAAWSHTHVGESSSAVHLIRHVAPNLAAKNGLDRRPRHRYVALHSLAVIRSSQPTHVHISGIIVQETQETLRIVTDGSIKCTYALLTHQASPNATPCSA